MSTILKSTLFHFSLFLSCNICREDTNDFHCLSVTLSEETGGKHWPKAISRPAFWSALALFAIREGSCWVPLATCYFELRGVATSLECRFLFSCMEIWWPSTRSVGYPAGHMEHTWLFGVFPGPVPWRSSFCLFTSHDPSLHTFLDILNKFSLAAF